MIDNELKAVREGSSTRAEAWEEEILTEQGSLKEMRLF
jgi:hypothetical protein